MQVFAVRLTSWTFWLDQVHGRIIDRRCFVAESNYRDNDAALSTNSTPASSDSPPGGQFGPDGFCELSDA